MTTTTAIVPAIPVPGLLARRERAIAHASVIADAMADVDGWCPTPFIGRDHRGDGERYTVEAATKRIDVCAWEELIETPTLWAMLGSKERAEWREALANGKVPPFTEEVVVATVEKIINERGDMLKADVTGLFEKLSSKHKTNSEDRFTAKMILTNVCEVWRQSSMLSPGHYKCDLLDSLDRILHRLRGLPEPLQERRDNCAYQRIHLATRGDMVAQFPFFRVVLFKNGNGHLHLDHDADVKRLNKVLSMANPNVVAAGRWGRK